MDELYYSNPQSKLRKINLFGATSNYDIHKDCIFNFNGIRFYRILIGLTDGNDNITTYFNNFDVGHKINSGDFIVFDFDRTTHQVIQDKQTPTPRIMLKIHFIVCENCIYSKKYIETIKQIYLYYEGMTRSIMQAGTDPTTLFQFFCGLLCQFYMNDYTKYIIVFVILLTITVINVVLKIKIISKNMYKIMKYVLISLVSIYSLIVVFYWTRYTLFGIK